MTEHHKHIRSCYSDYLERIEPCTVELEAKALRLYRELQTRIAAGTLRPDDDLLTEYEDAIREAGFYAGYGAGYADGHDSATFSVGNDPVKILTLTLMSLPAAQIDLLRDALRQLG